MLICMLLSPILSAQTSESDNTTTIPLDQTVHCPLTEGGDIVANSEAYSLEAAQVWLRLIPETEYRDELLKDFL